MTPTPRRAVQRWRTARWVTSGVVLALGLVPLVAGSAPVAAATTPAVPAPASPAELAAAQHAPGDTAPITVGVVRDDGNGSSHIERYSADTPRTAASLVRALDAQPDVERAAATSAVFRAAGDPGRAQQWGYNAVNFAAARVARTGIGQVVAVVDSGVSAWHQDLAGVLLPGADCFTFTTCVRQPYYDGTNDDFGHGTEVAGIIGAVADNNVGITGAAAGVRILPVKALDRNGSGDVFSIQAGIKWAVDNGATVVNLSLGNDPNVPMSTADLNTLQSAVDYAVNRGVPVIAAAGNSGPSNTAPSYPAGFSEVISAGSLASNLVVSSFSDRGVGGTPPNQWLDVVAPGQDILTTSAACSSCYAMVDGTSFAAPYTSAAVALMRSANGGLSPANIESVLERTARDLGSPGYDLDYGNGLIQPYRAVVEAATTYAENLDGPGVTGGFGRTPDALGPNTGTAAILYGGTPHVFYYDAAAGRLRHAFWDGARWRFEDLDGSGVPGGSGRLNLDVGQNPTAFLYGGQVHVVYSASNHSLRHGWWTGSKWMFETLDGPGGIAVGASGAALSSAPLTPSSASYQGAPHVFYERANGTRLGHAWWTGSHWSAEALDGTGSPAGAGRTPHAVGSNSTAQFINGQLDVFYDDLSTQDVRHAWYRNGWQFETIDGAGGPSGRTADAVGDASVSAYNNGPHIYYHDTTQGRLRHAFWNGSAWVYEVLDSPGANAGNEPLATGVDWMPYVYAFDATNGTLRRGFYSGFTWVFTPLDGASGTSVGKTTDSVGRGASVVLYGGRPHVFYLDGSTNRLRHTWIN